MSFIIRPWHIFLLGLSGWIHRQQQDMIEYLIAENQILKEKIGRKRIDRIQGALSSLGYEISDSTVGNTLRANGIEPAPERYYYSKAA